VGDYWVYVLELENGKYYVGQTNDLRRRLREHREGRSPFTRRNPMRKLVYWETFSTRGEAMKREKIIKSGKGREWIQRTLLFYSGRT